VDEAIAEGAKALGVYEGGDVFVQLEELIKEGLDVKYSARCYKVPVVPRTQKGPSGALIPNAESRNEAPVTPEEIDKVDKELAHDGEPLVDRKLEAETEEVIKAMNETLPKGMSVEAMTPEETDE